jgi:hypothetical protein
MVVDRNVKVGEKGERSARAAPGRYRDRQPSTLDVGRRSCEGNKSNTYCHRNATFRPNKFGQSHTSGLSTVDILVAIPLAALGARFREPSRYPPSGVNSTER